MLTLSFCYLDNILLLRVLLKVVANHIIGFPSFLAFSCTSWAKVSVIFSLHYMYIVVSLIPSVSLNWILKL